MGNEGSSATDSVTDVTDVTDIKKKEEGRRKRGRISPLLIIPYYKFSNLKSNFPIPNSPI
ncbi:hypothetical protein [Microcoleus sp. N9_B4]|uniref:hypothetical protein n=1 Tax=Microcoleus sp. N9_B4 TaxID=3055386 RepID=UPI002FCE9061